MKATAVKPAKDRAARSYEGLSAQDLLRTITQGVDGTAMPSWKVLTLEEREALVQYVLSLKQK